MFGLTKREQRWAAEQKAAETIVPALVAAIEAKAALETNERIAELEAELAKAKEENEGLAKERDQAAEKERRMIAEFLDVNYGIIPVAQIVDKIRAGKY